MSELGDVVAEGILGVKRDTWFHWCANVGGEWGYYETIPPNSIAAYPVGHGTIHKERTRKGKRCLVVHDDQRGGADEEFPKLPVLILTDKEYAKYVQGRTGG